MGGEGTVKVDLGFTWHHPLLIASPQPPSQASPLSVDCRVDSPTHRGLVPTQALGSGAEASLHSVVLTPGHACGQRQGQPDHDRKVLAFVSLFCQRSLITTLSVTSDRAGRSSGFGANALFMALPRLSLVSPF